MHFSPPGGSHYGGRVQICGTASELYFVGLKKQLSHFVEHICIYAYMQFDANEKVRKIKS